MFRISYLLFIVLLLQTGGIYASDQSDDLSVLNEEQNHSLITHLQTISIPPAVEKWAKRGHANYQKDPLKSKLAKAERDALGGVRTHAWIKDTFGSSEDDLVTDLKEIEGPTTWTIGEIDEAYQQLTSQHPVSSSTEPTFTLVKKVGINGLHRVPLGQNAIVQLASQFNFLESPFENDRVLVSEYIDDLTQGPLGSIEAAAASIHRYAAETNGKLPHALHDVLSEEGKGCYQNGYLKLGDISEAQCSVLQSYVSKNIDKLRILPQWVMCEASGAYQLQVFNAAPSFQWTKQPDNDTCAAKLSTLLVAKQYEVIAKMAVIRSLTTGKKVPLHLTLVGQGVFNNPPAAIAEALNQVADAIKSLNVSVYVHVYGQADEQKLMKALHNRKFELEHMTRAQFFAKK